MDEYNRITLFKPVEKTAVLPVLLGVALRSMKISL